MPKYSLIEETPSGVRLIFRKLMSATDAAMENASAKLKAQGRRYVTAQEYRQLVDKEQVKHG